MQRETRGKKRQQQKDPNNNNNNTTTTNVTQLEEKENQAKLDDFKFLGEEETTGESGTKIPDIFSQAAQIIYDDPDAFDNHHSKTERTMSQACVVKIPPHHFVHALEKNTSVIRLIEGPTKETFLENESVVLGPKQMIVIPPRHYCVISNPVVRDTETGRVVHDTLGQAKLRHGETEIRFEGEPFSLYPGEEVKGGIQALKVVPADSALRLVALRDFVDKYTNKDGSHNPEGKGDMPRVAGSEYLFYGPATFYPQIEIKATELIRASIVKQGQALQLQARSDCCDRDGVNHKAGENWLVSTPGTYLPDVHETVVRIFNATILTQTTALHLEATHSFTDAYGRQRKAGEEWLITLQDTETHLVGVHERLVGVKNLITLTDRQYCVINNPVDEDGKPAFGKQRLIRGEANFFLQPGEVLCLSPTDMTVLVADRALLLRANTTFADNVTFNRSPVSGDGRGSEHCTKIVHRQAGDEWLVCGPREFIPPLEVSVISRKNALIHLPDIGLTVFKVSTLVYFFILVALLVFLLFRVRAVGDL